MGYNVVFGIRCAVPYLVALCCAVLATHAGTAILLLHSTAMVSMSLLYDPHRPACYKVTI